MDGMALSGAHADGRAQRVEARLAPSPFLAGPLRRNGYDSSEPWMWRHYKPTLLAFVETLRAAGRHDGEGRVRLLEIGGGRGPQFTPEEAEKLGVTLTVNDIDARELSMAPKGFATACFNIAADVDPALHGQFDFIFSRMVFEHVKDAPRAWANVASLLAPGGVAFAFHPTLYCPPFVLNWLAPEAFSARLLKLLFPWRHDGDYPKFPARYEMCFSDPRKMVPQFKALGFSDVLIAPFYGHGYLRSVPVAREIEGALHVVAERRDIRALSSYAYTLVRR
jgi:SAM-dependent methyltransferase